MSLQKTLVSFHIITETAIVETEPLVLPTYRKPLTHSPGELILNFKRQCKLLILAIFLHT